MVTTANFATLRRLNFGMRALSEAPMVEGIGRELARYDAADAAAVSRQVRAIAGDELLLDRLLAVYAEVLAEPARDPDLASEQQAAAAYLRLLSPRLHERDLLQMAFQRLLRLPVAGAWIRRRAHREAPTHWFRELLSAMDGD